MKIPDKIYQILAYRSRSDLANLLRQSKYELNVSNTYGSRLFSLLTTLEVYSPINKNEELTKLPDDDQREIITAFHVLHPVRDGEPEINSVEFLIDPDASVLGLDEEVYVPKEIDTSYWRTGYFRLFISHSALIKEGVKKLRNHLIQYGISAFVAHEDIEPIKEWLNSIESALVTCDALVAMLDQNFKTSNWCDQEVGIVFGQNKFIIPIMLGIDPYGFIGKLQGIQGKGKMPNELAEEISHLLASAEKTKKKIAEALVEMFVNSSSYQNAQDNAQKLKMITYVNEALVRKIESALVQNVYIRESINLSQEIKNIIEQHNISNETVTAKEIIA